MASILDAPPVSVPKRPLRALLAATWKLRLQPSEPGWLDMALGAPLLDTTRARQLLDWRPTISGPDALRETLEGAAANGGFPTPPLQAES